MIKPLAAAAAAAALALAPTAIGATWDAALLAQDDNNSAHVARYDKLLNQLQPRCRQSRTTIARYTVSAKRVMASDGHYFTNLTLLLALQGTLPKGHTQVDCVGRYASMVVLFERHP